MRLLPGALCLAACFVVCPLHAAAAAESRAPTQMALTFDDLPYAAPPHRDTIEDARRVTTAILAVLGKHRAPAEAFVNEGKLQVEGEIDERVALLEKWADAGVVLGNHTFSHVDLDKVTAAEFEDEIVRGDTVTRRLMGGRGSRQLYFRYPYTHTGDTEAKKTEIEGFLKQRGYRIAPHTIDGEDYVFNRVFLASRDAGDAAGARRVCDAYVDFVIEATAFAEEAGRKIFGRGIPQTLLLHANDLNADCLDPLLRRLEARGYGFVSLDAAMADPAYATPDTLVTTYGPTWLWRWMKSRGMKVSFRGDPEPPGWISDLYRKASAPQGKRD